MPGITNATYKSGDTSHYVRVIFPKMMLMRLYASTIYEVISNTQFEGEIKGGGDSVEIAVDPEITVFNYDAQVGIPSYVEPTSDGVMLNIDQAIGWAYKIKSASAAAAHVELKPSFARSAAASMKVAIDKNVLGFWTTQADAANMGSAAGAISGDIDLGVTGLPRTITAADVMHWIHECNQVLDEQNVKEEGRYITLPAWAVTLLKDSDIKDASVTGDSKGTIRTGILGMVDGLLLYRSNNLPWDAVNKESTILFGTNEATTFAAQLAEVSEGDLQNDYGRYYRGLTVFGRGVVQPKMLGASVIKKG